MEILGQAKKVTIYIGESDRWKRKPLHVAILEMLKREGCAGATVTRALTGFGAHSRIHTASLVDLSADLPLIVEWVDNPARVERVMPRLREMVIEGLITVHDVEVVTYSHRRLREVPAQAPVSDLMSREVRAMTPDTPVTEAVELLLDQDYRALPVVDEERRVVGILTDGDLLHRAGLLPISAQQALTASELSHHLAMMRRAKVTVGHLMTTPPITVQAATSTAEAVQQMVEHDIKRLPVVDEKGRLMGIVSRLDLFRVMAQPPVAEAPRRPPPPGTHVTVGEVMMRQVPTVRTDAPLAEVVDLIVSTAQRRVVVVDDEQRVVGIITDGDLLKRAAEAERGGILQALASRVPASQQEEAIRLRQRTASELMTPQPVTVRPHTPLLDALQLLLEHRIKRLPVVDDEGRLVGLLGRGGVLQVLSREMGADSTS
jgi:CBS domain-containing protein